MDNVLQGEPDQRVVFVEFSQLQVVGGGCSRGGGIGPGVGHADHPRCRVSTESELGFETRCRHGWAFTAPGAG